MNFIDTVRSGIEALIGHRLRSCLTVLGLLIGVAAVILTVGLGQGASSSVSNAISSLGSNLLIVTPGSATATNGVRGGFGSASTLTLSGAAALSTDTVAPDIAGVAPTMSQSSSSTPTASPGPPRSREPPTSSSTCATASCRAAPSSLRSR